MQENVKKREMVDEGNGTDRQMCKIRRILVGAVREGAWLFGGWLMGQAELAFETFPLGLSLLCASGNHSLAILLGLLSAGLWQMKMPVIYIIVYLAAGIVCMVSGLLLETNATKESLRLRVMQRLFAPICDEKEEPMSEEHFGKANADRGVGRIRSIFSDGLCLCLATAAIGALLISLYRIFVYDFRYYDLFAAIFSVLVAPAATLVYSFSLKDIEKEGWFSRISQAALLFSLAYAADSVLLIGLPLAPMIALFFTLCVSERDGIFMGSAVGILCGIAYEPMHAPAYLLAALVYGMLKKAERVMASAPIAALAALSWLVYADGIGRLVIFVPSCLLVATVFSLSLRIGAVESTPVGENTEADAARRRVSEERHNDANDRFRGISEAFSSLSEVFYNLSDRFRRPGTLDLRRICDRSFDLFCTDCPNKTVCWGLEYTETLNTVNRLTSALHTKGKVTRAQIPAPLASRCETVAEILESINNECAKLTGEMLRDNRTEIFAMDYEAAARIINDALEEDDGEYRFDPTEEQRIAEYLYDAGVRARGVTVYGKRRRQIVVRGVDVENAHVTVDTMRADLGEMCGMTLSRPRFSAEDNSATMILTAKQRISVEGAQKNLSADGGVSGDSVNLFSNKKDYFYALICDGMGAGHEAAMTSGLCTVFLEKMLRAGNRAHTSLKMLNNLVRSRTSDSARECSSTVDLLEIDLMTGCGVFIKSGAAPSFVVRAGVVQRLQCGSAPIGIISDLDAPGTPYELHVGDLIIMVSDGILQDDPDCEWLEHYLGGAYEEPAETIVSRICRHAVDYARHDDCSVIALRIGQATE